MEYARYNDSLINAQDFSGLPPNELWAMRDHLLCPECGGPAFFRKETRNDREACFGARPHADWCGLKAAQSPTNRQDRSSFKASFQPAQCIVVDFGFGAHHQNQHLSVQQGEDQRFTTQDRSTAGSGFSANATRQIRLVPLLRMLNSAPDLRSLPETVEIAGLGTFSTPDFFVPFDSIMPGHQNMTLGFFGKVTNAKLDSNEKALWLNFGGRTSTSICVPWALICDLYERFRISDVTELSGANALIVGRLQVSQYGKRHIVLQDMSYLAIDLDRG